MHFSVNKSDGRLFLHLPSKDKASKKKVGGEKYPHQKAFQGNREKLGFS
jgi:hypothetical protein